MSLTRSVPAVESPSHGARTPESIAARLKQFIADSFFEFGSVKQSLLSIPSEEFTLLLFGALAVLLFICIFIRLFKTALILSIIGVGIYYLLNR